MTTLTADRHEQPDVLPPALRTAADGVARVDFGPLPGTTAGSVRRPDVLDRDGHGLKRAIDVTISLVLILLLVPVLLVVALAVKLSSPGNVFFLQERIGRNGTTFRMIKFRSMRSGTHAEILRDAVDARRYQENGFKLAADDPRITRIGGFIRATSIDELPQLFNVLRGDMSLVGIRPVTAEEFELRSVTDQVYYRLMRPGMTGLWQVSGRSSTAGSERHALDRRYVDTWSFENDLKVLLRTPLAVVRTGNTF